jgi:hypothetical protein
LVAYVSAAMFIVVNSINQEHNHTHTFCLHTHTKAIENGRRLEEEEEKSFCCNALFISYEFFLITTYIYTLLVVQVTYL